MYTVLVGNKADDDEKREVETRLGDCFALQNGMRYFETSAKNSDVEKIFEHLALVLLRTKKPISPFPAKPNTPSETVINLTDDSQKNTRQMRQRC